MPRVLIIGGGAGPVAAMALQRAGSDAAVYEVYPQHTEGVASYLTVATSGIDALRAMGVDQPVPDAGFPPPEAPIPVNSATASPTSSPPASSIHRPRLRREGQPQPMTAPLVTAPPASPSQPADGQRPRRTRRKPVRTPMDLGIPARLRRPRRRAIAMLLLTGLLLVLVWPLPAFAASSRATGAASRVALRADFNGDGNVDLAIGAQGENDFTGVVHVLYGSSTGLTATGSQLWSQNSPGIAGEAEPGDDFGFALAAGDFNGDGRADLATGARGENNGAGVVHVLYGSPTGLTATGSQLWSQNSPGIAGEAETGDEFGEALAAGDFNGDDRADLAIGTPGENRFAGVVQVLDGTAPGGLTATGGQLWSQDSSGIAGEAEMFDVFGFALAAGDFNGNGQADLAIGVPGENNSAGLVQALYGSPTGLTATGSQLWSQNSPGISGEAETGDSFGDALAAGSLDGDQADLAIGVPGENNSAGVVQVLYGTAASGLTATGSQLWSQDSPGIAGGAETGDGFGDALAAGDFNGDGGADLAIGARGENNFAGVVHVLGGSPSGLTATGSQLWSQNSPGIAGGAESGDLFGSAVAAGDFNGNGQADLAIGAPGENNGAGVVHVLDGTVPGGLTATGSQLWSQDSPGIAGGAETFDFFGGALAVGTLSTGGAGTTNPAVTSPPTWSRTARDGDPDASSPDAASSSARAA